MVAESSTAGSLPRLPPTAQPAGSNSLRWRRIYPDFAIILAVQNFLNKNRNLIVAAESILFDYVATWAENDGRMKFHT